MNYFIVAWMHVCTFSFAGTNYASYLGVPNASAAVTDAVGNVWIVAGSSVIELAPDGSKIAVLTPVADAILTSIAIDAQSRVIVGGSTKTGGVVARIPDFTTLVAGPVAAVAADANGDLFAAATVSGVHGKDALLVKISGSTGAVVQIQTLGGAADDFASDLVVDLSGAPIVALTTSSPELPVINGFQPRLNGVPGTVSYDGGNFFYGIYTFSATVNQWLLLADRSTMYAATQGQGVYHSADRGQTWDQRISGLPDTIVTAIAVDPTAAATLYAATTQGLAKSTNSGTTWTNLTLPAVTTVAVSVKDHNQVFAAGNCAFYKSADAGKTWVAQKADDGCVLTFLIDPNDVNGVYAVSPSGVFQGGASWTRIASLAGITAAVADPLDFSVWYATATGGIYKSTNKGAAWILVNSGSFTTVYAGRPHVLAGTASGTVVASLDGGANWNATVTPPSGSQPVRSLFVDSGVYFVGTSYTPAIWVAKLSPVDGSVLYSTYLGGSGSQSAARLAVDAQANVTVAFETDSTDAVVTQDALQKRPGGGIDLQITRLNPNFGLQYASYWGGAGDERLGSMKLDNQAFLYLTGSREGDAFVRVVNQGLTGFVFSANFGGGGTDQGVTLLPSNGNAILIGRTQSSDLPVTAGPAFDAPADSFVASFANVVGYQSLGAIRNAASLLTGPVAPGSLVTIDGTFGDLSGVSVSFKGSPAVVVQVRDASMDVQIPADLAIGQEAVVLVATRDALYQSTVTVNSTSPGLFSANGNGQGVALGQIVRVDTTTGTSTVQPIFSCDANTCTPIPIDIGDDGTQVYLVLTATGLRNQTDLSQFQVTIGGMPARVVDLQPQGVASGLDALTIQVPQPDGVVGPLEWKIQVMVDGRTSNAVSIWVE